jgi:hypothetical protein
LVLPWSNERGGGAGLSPLSLVDEDRAENRCAFKGNRLESLRAFLRRVWKSCRDPDEFSDVNAVNLSAELRDEIATANDEWKKIDRDLLKWLGGTGAALVSSGVVGFLPAATAGAITGVTGLIQAKIRRSTYKERYPAGFFLGLR